VLLVASGAVTGSVSAASYMRRSKPTMNNIIHDVIIIKSSDKQIGSKLPATVITS